MSKQTVDEILQQGIQGPKEIKPEERRRFLGTLRERIIIALNKNQVIEREIYPQVEKSMKENLAAHLFLNGNIKYEKLSKYVKLAKKYKIEHTIVTNKEFDTEIGLVLAMDHAIDKEEIFILKNEPKTSAPPPRIEKASFFSKLFKGFK
ncbi:YueI family protein [Neobacillus sp. PS3-40]|uniref:YueI family protein n=1 Tax=Neobacillus sp. PS3-40 TaxID=3070679 RepID=UPI0027DFBD9A|nr:YueI family protein [Neobacillus sp. PS3-40]WML42764.1 YueI family protein [Neobacillus sp. PS3-40]